MLYFLLINFTEDIEIDDMLLTMLKKQEQVETWFLISKFITDQSLVLKKL